eukprot:CAMPEP_0181079590 /NCGR_PEP_ID=MMETSP1071-20121207/2112_1 /TAXON_ID=35127 /ORGANISM="Thalassiosira sp., Strain NH16" /LENGTH=162 /DNA_ID=CAMNT_0023161005 /DNA_START=190 /DNA_END=678 /DNA_ORIENTATION=+
MVPGASFRVDLIKDGARKSHQRRSTLATNRLDPLHPHSKFGDIICEPEWSLVILRPPHLRREISVESIMIASALFIGVQRVRPFLPHLTDKQVFLSRIWQKTIDVQERIRVGQPRVIMKRSGAIDPTPLPTFISLDVNLAHRTDVRGDGRMMPDVSMSPHVR